MLLREVEPVRHPLLYAAAVGVLSFLAAVVLSACFLSLVACARPAPVLRNVEPCARIEVHAGCIGVGVYRDCQWRCQ